MGSDSRWAAALTAAVEHREIRRGNPLMRVWLPFPPSTNGLFVNAGKGGRNLSARYRKWREEAGWALKHQPQSRRSFSGPVSLHMALTNPRKVHADCSNYIKAVEDLICQHGIIQGDDERFVRGVSIEWADPPAKEPGVVIEIAKAA